MIDFRQYERSNRGPCASKCPKCGKLYYPEPMICAACGTRRDPSGARFAKWDTVPIGGKCTLLSWTRLYSLPPDFTDRYVLFGIVELDGGLRASGRLLAEQPTSGMSLSARTDVVRGGGEEAEYGLVFDEAAGSEAGPAASHRASRGAGMKKPALTPAKR